MNNTKLLENTARWRKTKRGLVTNLYNKMKARNTVDFNLEYLHEFSNCKKFDRLFNEWVKSGYIKNAKPSIDRISNKKGYEKANIQWLSWSDNRYKQTMERRIRGNKVVQILNGKIVNTFNSQREAVKMTGLSQGNICMVLYGKRNHTGGFQFKYIYENPCEPLK